MGKVILNSDASAAVQLFFKERGYEPCLFRGYGTYEAVSNHPDMYMFYDGTLFIDPSVASEYPIKNKVISEAIGEKYPDNVKYNVAKVGQYIIANEKTMSKEIRHHIDQMAYELIAVKQGYANCSTLVVDNKSIITSDRGIHKACKERGLDALLIEAGHIELPGLSHGFIGGCGVRLKEEFFFSGNINKHPNINEIKQFIESRNLTIVCTDEALIDLGSFIIIESVK